MFAMPEVPPAFMVVVRENPHALITQELMAIHFSAKEPDDYPVFYFTEVEAAAQCELVNRFQQGMFAFGIN